jgi:glucosamine--fructose-6-phosphate aminotransferase (isomerizing)
MLDNTSFTYNEIISQPEAWADALQAVDQAKTELLKLNNGGFQQIVFTGCGSTYYLSLAAAALFQEQSGLPCRAVPGGELLLNPRTALTAQKTLLVAISRSGSTSETVKAVEAFKKAQAGTVVAITNYGEEALAGLADLALVISKGQESSVAQTRSFASMFVAVNAMSAVMSGHAQDLSAMQGLPEIGEKLIKQYGPFAHELGANLNVDRFYFLGSGLRYGLACETNLKMKEMTLTHSEPFHFLEFRHGPMSMVGASAVVIGMLSDANRGHEQQVLDEMKLLGGQVVSLAENGADVVFNSGLPEAVRGVLYLPALQLTAYERSIAKGLNPDQPTNLSKVVQLKF